MFGRNRSLATRAVLAIMLVPALLGAQGCSLLPFGAEPTVPPPPPPSSGATGTVESTRTAESSDTAEPTTTAQSQICERVTGGQLRKLQKKGARVVDVRSAKRHAILRIPDSESVPMRVLAKRSRKWDKDKRVIIVALTAAQGRVAAGYLAEKGFKNACYLKDGVMGWDGDWTGLVDFKHLKKPEVILIHGGSISEDLDDEWSGIEKKYAKYAKFSRHSSTSSEYGTVALLLGGTPAFVIVYPNGMAEGYSGQEGATSMWSRLEALRLGKPVPWPPSLEEALERPDELR